MPACGVAEPHKQNFPPDFFQEIGLFFSIPPGCWGLQHDNGKACVLECRHPALLQCWPLTQATPSCVLIMVALLLSAPRGAALQKMPSQGRMPAEQIPVATGNAVCHAQRCTEGRYGHYKDTYRGWS